MSNDVNKKSEKKKSKEKQRQEERKPEELAELEKRDEKLLVPSESSEENSLGSSIKDRSHHSGFTSNIISAAFKKLSLGRKLLPTALKEPTFECFIDCFQTNGFENIITISGAGVSTAAGLPDFRTPVHGLYDNLSKYNLPYPQAIFDYSYFLENPEPFFDLSRKLIPGNYKPTIAHYFIKLLETKDILLRHYTQNIDGLDRLAGLSEELLVEAHGSFYTSHCLKCNKEYSFEWIRGQIMAGAIPRCVLCNEVVKPDVVLFGENLPTKFSDNIKIDFPKADLLIIMGSSLAVEPFASIVKRVHRKCPRIIINNQEVGKKIGIVYDARRNERDIFLQGTCDDGCMKIINEMEWTDEFNQLIAEIEKNRATSS